MPEDKIQCETSADTAKISAGNTEVLFVEGIADDSVFSAVRVDGHTVSVNIERKVKQSEDNTAGSDIPPFEPELCFTYTDKDGNPLSGAEAVELTEENMAQFGIDQLPEISVSVPGSGRYTVQVEGELPTAIWSAAIRNM